MVFLTTLVKLGAARMRVHMSIIHNDHLELVIVANALMVSNSTVK